jgi:hypothetical protein
MTSISAASSSNYQSPLQKLQDELQSEVDSGAINSSDQAALSSALTDINASLQSGSASDPASGANASPGDLKSKIDNLIAGEVSSGKLTSDQATELQGVFKAAFASGGASGADGAGGPGGAGAAHHGHHGHHGGGASPTDASSTDGGHGQRQFRRRHPAAVSPVVAEFAVRLVVAVVQRGRYARHRRQQRFIRPGASGRLSILT